MEQIFGKGVSKGVAAGPISFYRRASGVIPRHEVSGHCGRAGAIPRSAGDGEGAARKAV